MEPRTVHSRSLRTSKSNYSLALRSTDTLFVGQGLPVAIVAVIWMAFSVTILVFPTTPTPTGADMNYTVVVWGGWLTLCTIYFFFPHYGGRYWFRGPVATIDIKGSGDRASTESAEGLQEKEGHDTKEEKFEVR